MTNRIFQCIVTRETAVEIHLDDEVFTPEWFEEFRKYFHPFDELEEVARHLALFHSEFPDESFIEGFGHVLRNGSLPFSFEKDRKIMFGINIIDDYSDTDVEVKYVGDEK